MLRLVLKFVCVSIISFFVIAPGTSAAFNYEQLRKQMVLQQVKARGVEDPALIRAMLKVPRHLFVPEKYRSYAYGDYPLPIGEGQTISQPYIVAFMTAALKLKPTDKVLEIGTGSGYQAAVLAQIVKEVYTIEIIAKLSKKAARTLESLGYKNIFLKIGDGYKGWPEKAPFDAIIVTCAPEKIPPPLVEQLAEHGRIIIPVREQWNVQKLVLGTKVHGQLETKVLLPVKFVPMVREK